MDKDRGIPSLFLDSFSFSSHEELVSLLCIGVDFESWVKVLGFMIKF
jgi:hypothetical protein